MSKADELNWRWFGIRIGTGFVLPATDIEICFWCFWCLWFFGDSLFLFRFLIMTSILPFFCFSLTFSLVFTIYISPFCFLFSFFFFFKCRGIRRDVGNCVGTARWDELKGGIITTFGMFVG